MLYRGSSRFVAPAHDFIGKRKGVVITQSLVSAKNYCAIHSHLELFKLTSHISGIEITRLLCFVWTPRLGEIMRNMLQTFKMIHSLKITIYGVTKKHSNFELTHS